MELCQLDHTASMVAAEGEERDGGLLPTLNCLNQGVTHVTSAHSVEPVTWPHFPARRAGNVRDDHGIFDEHSLSLTQTFWPHSSRDLQIGQGREETGPWICVTREAREGRSS